jgi:hypothetical protein
MSEFLDPLTPPTPELRVSRRNTVFSDMYTNLKNIVLFSVSRRMEGRPAGRRPSRVDDGVPPPGVATTGGWPGSSLVGLAGLLVAVRH